MPWFFFLLRTQGSMGAPFSASFFYFEIFVPFSPVNRKLPPGRNSSDIDGRSYILLFPAFLEETDHL
jgi:hypothetical protein